VSLQPIRLLERLSRRRNACIADKDHIALFDRRETSFHVKTHRQRLVTDIFTATVTASKDPRSFESFCAQEHALQKHPPLPYSNIHLEY
jgi:hypothetical protein